MLVEGNRLQAGDLEIDLEMVLQIAADTLARRQRLHPGGLQHSPRPDARALQDRR